MYTHHLDTFFTIASLLIAQFSVFLGASQQAYMTRSKTTSSSLKPVRNCTSEGSRAPVRDLPRYEPHVQPCS